MASIQSLQSPYSNPAFLGASHENAKSALQAFSERPSHYLEPASQPTSRLPSPVLNLPPTEAFPPVSSSLPAQPPLWSWTQGRLVELSASAHGAQLSAAISAVHQAQQDGEVCVWITSAPRAPSSPGSGIPLGSVVHAHPNRVGTSFYPPDVQDAGVDLNALVIVRIPEQPHGKEAYTFFRAAEMLLRSSAFGLVVCDLHDVALPKHMDTAWQSRLHALVRRDHSGLLLLTSSGIGQPSLGPLIALRFLADIKDTKGERANIQLTCLKNKAGLSISSSAYGYRLPDEFCRPNIPAATPHSATSCHPNTDPVLQYSNLLH